MTPLCCSKQLKQYVIYLAAPFLPALTACKRKLTSEKCAACERKRWRLLPPMPLCATIILPSPMITLCASCTRLSIFTCAPIISCSERAAINGDIDANLVHLELSWKLLSARLGNFDVQRFCPFWKKLCSQNIPNAFHAIAAQRM